MTDGVTGLAGSAARGGAASTDFARRSAETGTKTYDLPMMMRYSGPASVSSIHLLRLTTRYRPFPTSTIGSALAEGWTPERIVSRGL